MMREFREGGAGAGLFPEEIDKDALVERRVLIDENADGFACFEAAPVTDHNLFAARESASDFNYIGHLNSRRYLSCFDSIVRGHHHHRCLIARPVERL